MGRTRWIYSPGSSESDHCATLIVPADGGGAKKRNEDNKKGDTKGSSRADGGSGNKDGNSSNAIAGIKSKQDGGDGGKRLVSHC